MNHQRNQDCFEILDILSGFSFNFLADKQKMLASCLDEIEDDRDLVASAKCLVKARCIAHFSTCRQDFEQGQTTDKSNDTPAFITINDSEKEEQEYSFKNRDHEKRNIERYNQLSAREKNHISHSRFETKSFQRYSPKALSSGFSSILNLNHLKNFTPHDFSAFKYLTDSASVSNSSNQERSPMSRKLPSIDQKSGRVNLTPRKRSTRKNKTSETLYLIENEIKKSTNFVWQPFNSPHYEKVEKMEWEKKHSRKSELIKNVNLPESTIDFRKSDWYAAVPSSYISEQNQKSCLNFIHSKLKKKKIWQRRRRSYGPITNHVMKSDHLIVDVSDCISFIILQTIPINMFSKLFNFY